MCQQRFSFEIGELEERHNLSKIIFKLYSSRVLRQIKWHLYLAAVHHFCLTKGFQKTCDFSAIYRSDRHLMIFNIALTVLGFDVPYLYRKDSQTSTVLYSLLREEDQTRNSQHYFPFGCFNLKFVLRLKYNFRDALTLLQKREIF